jgi:hypothetical protein
MAIELIENSELAALAPSRIGTKNFIDDDRYSNLSIVSKKEKRRRAESAQGEVDATWSIDPKYKNDCDYLFTRLQILQDNIDAEMAKNPSKVTIQRYINPMRNWETQYKNAISLNNCVGKLKKKETEASKKETLDILEKATDTKLPMQTEEETKSNKTTKYIIYGVGGVITLVALILLLKKKD